MSQDGDLVIDLADLPHHAGQACGPSRRAFCVGGAALVAGAGLVTLGAGCSGDGPPRIGTGGIDNEPGSNVPSEGSPDMARSSTNGTTTGNGGTTTGNGGTTTGNGGTTTGNGGTTTGNGGTTTGNGGTTTGTGGTTGRPASCSTSMVAAGASSAVAVGKAKRITSGSLDAWLCQDSGGFYALDNYCPHRGCAVNFESSGSFSCPCHGATFNFNGVQTNRESPQPMDHLSVCIDSSSNVFIDPNTTVAATVRV